MTKKDFFRVIIKLFGAYAMIISLFQLLPSYFMMHSSFGEFDWIPLIYLIITSVVIFLFFTGLLYSTDRIINVLKLDKGFDDDHIDFKSFNTTSITKLGVILLGGYLIVTNVVNFIMGAYNSIKYHTNSNSISNVLDSISDPSFTFYDLIHSGLSLFVGYLLINNYQKIAVFLNKDRSNPDYSAEEQFIIDKDEAK